MSKKVKKVILTVLKFLFSSAAIWWVLSKISFKEVLTVFSKATIWMLLLALLCVFVSYLFSAFRQHASLKIIRAKLSNALNIKLFWVGLFYNLFLPGGIGGDGYKVYLIHKYRNNGVRKNIGAMLVNRISGLVAIGMFTIILYYLAGDPIGIGYWGFIFIPLIYLFYYFVLAFFLKSFQKIHANQFEWSLAVQFMQFLAAFLILYSFNQLDGLYNYLFLFFFSAIATALPITIGGIGAREMVFLFGAKYLHLDNELSIALSLMFQLLNAFVSFFGVYWVFFPAFRKEAISSEKPEDHQMLKENIS